VHLDEQGRCPNPHCFSNQETLFPPADSDASPAEHPEFRVRPPKTSSYSDLVAVKDDAPDKRVIPEPSGIDEFEGIENERTPTETPDAKRPNSRKTSGTRIRLDKLLPPGKKAKAD
jgi:hypothetical protein